MVMSMPKLLIQSNGWSNSVIAIAAGVVGSQTILFNQRFASIKSVLILASGGTNCTNKSFDFIDITDKGTYQLMIGSQCFPQLKLNCKYNRAAILQELKNHKGIYMILKKS